MVGIDIQVNLNGLDAAFQNKVDQIDKQVSNLVSDLVDIAERWVIVSAPRKTGRLKSSGIKKEKKETQGVVFTSKTAVPYIDFVIDGTRPHLIVPKNKMALFWKGGKYPVKHVHHPGTKSNPFVDTGFDNSQSAMNIKINNFENWLVEV